MCGLGNSQHRFFAEGIQKLVYRWVIVLLDDMLKIKH